MVELNRNNEIKMNTEQLEKKIQIRYAGEAKTACSLSCGSILDYAGISSGEIVVDLGSGRGSDVMKAALEAGKYGFAIGIDFTPEMIETGKALAGKLSISNCEFRLADIDCLPVENNFADVVISNCTINHAPDKSKVYSEIFRILKFGGRFIISDIIAVNPLNDEIKSDHEAWAACYGGAITKEENLLAMETAGFTTVEILEESDPYEKGDAIIKSITWCSYKK